MAIAALALIRITLRAIETAFLNNVGELVNGLDTAGIAISARMIDVAGGGLIQAPVGLASGVSALFTKRRIFAECTIECVLTSGVDCVPAYGPQSRGFPCAGLSRSGAAALCRPATGDLCSGNPGDISSSLMKAVANDGGQQRADRSLET
jgi:hypothetical protein